MSISSSPYRNYRLPNNQLVLVPKVTTKILSTASRFLAPAQLYTALTCQLLCPSCKDSIFKTLWEMLIRVQFRRGPMVWAICQGIIDVSFTFCITYRCQFSSMKIKPCPCYFVGPYACKYTNCFAPRICCHECFIQWLPTLIGWNSKARQFHRELVIGDM